ncbi:hypothetical protein [Sphingomonas sp.]|uniref:hypothetical protein n=1 Tax=Sphingomonas sp. TaxID=28214 RepID=UPI0025DD9096|nr:hypothetical protein [Sphingomonas sp.]
MRNWGKMVAVAVAPLVLTGCLWGPGKFTSNLALNKAGTFVLDYKGEIVLQMPEEKGAAAEPWSDKKLKCFKDGHVETSAMTDDSAEPDEDARPCTKVELGKAKADFDKDQADRIAAKRKENEEMAKLFGLPGSDDASSRRFAANLMKYQGWRSVTYVGKGVYNVDYHVEGRLTQDYAFPLMPDTDLMIPFITLRRRADGSVMVSAPALTGGSGPFSARAKMMGLPDKGEGGPVSRAEGRFTVTTDGEILTNNSEDGPTATTAGRQVHWDVGPGSTKIPETLVRL